MARKKHRNDAAPVETELPITPMLDMTFQLMAFFIMAFKPMPTEGQLSIMLPKDDPSKNSVESSAIPTDEVDDYKLKIFSANGDIGSMALKTGAAEEAIAGNDRMNALLAKLNSIAKTPGRTVKITIESEPGLKYARLIDLMDICKKAGFESIGIAELKAGKAAEAPPAKN